MTDKLMKTITYTLLICCVILFSINSQISACVAILACGLQQMRIDKAREKAKSAQSVANVYQSLIQKQLCKYKEVIFNGKQLS